MKIKSILVLGVILLAMVISFGSCKKADDEVGIVTVTISAGVSGQPAAGAYNFVVGNEVTYGFTLDAGYKKLTVLLDGAEVDATGTFTVTGDHELQAYSDENGQFTLTVTATAGVSGTPGTGTFTHAQAALVNYSYTLDEGYTDLTVKLDGTAVASSGTVSMSADHTISISATAKNNIQGSWLLTETYDDGSSFDVTVVFSGDYTSGTVTDSDDGSGTYTLDEDADDEVAFTLVFPDVTYEYTGDFSDDDTMSGDCERYQSSDNVISGTWTATRSTATVASLGMMARSGKGKFHRR